MGPDGGNTIALVRLSGDIDFVERSALRQMLSQLEGADVAIIDMSSVPYADSTFLNEIVALHQRMARHDRPFSIRLIGVSNQLRRVFEVAQIDRLVEFWDDEGGAKRAGIVTNP